MSLKKIKRAEKKGTESVMDEKFALLFWSEFAIGNGEFSYQVRCSTSTQPTTVVCKFGKLGWNTYTMHMYTFFARFGADLSAPVGAY